jgi:tetrapyrrole methylase family protein/MazG family protein
MMKPRITIVGLGPAGIKQLTLEVWQMICSHHRIIVRTIIHPAAEDLRRENIDFSSCDHFYEEGKNFQEIYEDISNYLIKEAISQAPSSDVLYCVPGHPLVAEETVQLLLIEAPKQGVEVVVKSAMSFLDPTFTVLGLDPTKGGFAVLDALALPKQLPVECGCLFTQVYNRFVAGDLKLDLLEAYQPEQPVTVVYHAGISGEEKLLSTVLAKLDHEACFDHLTSVFIPGISLPAIDECCYPLDPLVQVFNKLLGPEGCPWDREQTHQSLKRYLLEETYEVLEAIDLADMDLLQEELGDVLMQVVFHGALASRQDNFDYNDIIRGVTEKLIRRHPHVFGEAQADQASQVEVIWQEIKKAEKQNKPQAGTVQRHLYEGLPALLMAVEMQKLSKKITGQQVNFVNVEADLQQDWGLLSQSLSQGNLDEEILGRFLFTLTVLADSSRISAETALIHYLQKRVRELPDDGENMKKSYKS